MRSPLALRRDPPLSPCSLAVLMIKTQAIFNTEVSSKPQTQGTASTRPKIGKARKRIRTEAPPSSY